MKFLFFFLLLSCLHGTAQIKRIPKWKITDVEKLIAESDSILVINFWATFCVPCIEEIPDLIKYTTKYKKDKVKLYLVSLDPADYYPEKISRFLIKRKIKSNVTWLEETNADYFCPIIDEKWSGAIPATLFINKKNGYRKFFEKKLTATEIETNIKEAIQ